MTSSTAPVLFLKPWTKQITTTRNMQQNLVNETDSETQSTSEDNFHQTFYNYEPSKLSMTLTVQPHDNFQKNIQIQSTQQTTQSIPNLLDVRKFSVLTQDEMIRGNFSDKKLEMTKKSTYPVSKKKFFTKDLIIEQITLNKTCISCLTNFGLFTIGFNRVPFSQSSLFFHRDSFPTIFKKLVSIKKKNKSLRFTQQSTSFFFKAKAGQTSAELIFEFSCQLNNNFLPPSFQRKDSISFSLFQ